MSEIERVSGIAGLKKYEMKVTTIVAMIYCLVAAGAFGIEDMISASGPGLAIVMLCVFPIIWALPFCLIVAELGSVLPAEGGVYVWIKEAYGEFWGFLVGFWETIAIYLSNAVYVVLMVGYAGKFFEINETQAYVLKVAIILIFTIINLMGIQEVGKASMVLSVLVLLAFILVSVVGFMNWHYNPMTPFMPEGASVIDSMGISFAIVIWMYCGYECLSNMAGEISNPQVIPKGLLIAMPLIALSYIIPTIASLGSIGNWESWATEGEGTVGYMDVLTQNLGPAFGIVFLVVAILSQASMFNAYMASGSRGFFVLADDNLCPKFLVKVSKKRGVPYISILLLSAVTLIMCTFNFSTLLLFLTPLGAATYIIMFSSIRKIRQKYPISERKGLFVIPGGKIVLHLVYIVPIIVGMTNILVNGTEYFLLGFVPLTLGVVAYIIFKFVYGGLYKRDPENHPINPRTRLAVGDLARIGLFFIIFGAYATLGSLFLNWYEGSWASEYYLETYGSGVLWGNFDLMISILKYGGLASILVGALLVTFSKITGRKNNVEENV